MATDQIERRARRLHSDAVAAEGGIGLAREELSVVPHADIDQTGRLVLGAAARARDARDPRRAPSPRPPPSALRSLRRLRRPCRAFPS